jgi:hypothetical protein
VKRLKILTVFGVQTARVLCSARRDPLSLEHCWVKDEYGGRTPLVTFAKSLFALVRR